MSWGDRARALAPAALLAAIAALGVRNHVAHDQSSWEGASFGMFATYDNHTSRLVAATVDGPDGAVRVALPEDLEDDALRLRVAPSQGAIDALAEAIAQRAPGATSVRVELWRIALAEPGVLTLRFEPMLTATVEP